MLITYTDPNSVPDVNHVPEIVGAVLLCQDEDMRSNNIFTAVLYPEWQGWFGQFYMAHLNFQLDSIQHQRFEKETGLKVENMKVFPHRQIPIRKSENSPLEWEYTPAKSTVALVRYEPVRYNPNSGCWAMTPAFAGWVSKKPKSVKVS